MEELVTAIIKSEFSEDIVKFSKIEGLGVVNDVFQVKLKDLDCIVRINESRHKKIEFLKEEWCLKKASDLCIQSPKVFKLGEIEGHPYMIQNSVEGLNGSRCTDDQKVLIWKKIGEYASKFHKVDRIEVPQVEENEFHANWRSRLDYNIELLTEEDSLLQKGIFIQKEYDRIQSLLLSLRECDFIEGLVHGDLCPRNTIFKDQLVTLLDWGTAGINIVPHSEIGIVLMENSLNEKEFHSFLIGLGINTEEYRRFEREVKIISLLHRLDKYRWACDYDQGHLEEYEIKIRNIYKMI